MIDDGDRARKLVGLLQVLRREKDRRALADERSDDLPHAEAASRIQTGRGLVEEEHFWVAAQGARKVEPAAHSARVRLHDAVGRLVQVELLEKVVGAPLRLGFRELVQPGEEDKVLATGQVVVDRGVLARESDDRSQLLSIANDVSVADDAVGLDSPPVVSAVTQGVVGWR